jgi:ubiquitin C-terminal hydrolase
MLQRFTAAEYLEGDNKYKCPKQRKAVRAAKRMSIEVRCAAASV